MLRRQGDGALHGVQITAQTAVPFWGEAFEVDIGRVETGEELPSALFVNRAIGDQNIDHASFMDEGGAVPDLLISHQRLVVGVGHTDVSLGNQLRSSAVQRSHPDRSWPGRSQSGPPPIHTDGNITHTSRSYVPHHLKPLQGIFFPGADATLLAGDINLLFHRVHAVQVGEEQPPPLAAGHNNAIFFHVQLGGG